MEANAEASAPASNKAERAATQVADIELEDDPAKDNYGQMTGPAFSPNAEEVELRSLDGSYDGAAELAHTECQTKEKAPGAVIRQKFKTDFYVIDKFSEITRPFYAKLDDSRATVGDGVHVTNTFDFFLRGQEVFSP
ncbi:hypothetical protein F5B21DRAFT_498965 [Xylaria acuta]|nr:hypothetical protein F5B21DRAFT_498965 [Xylaria acuta]